MNSVAFKNDVVKGTDRSGQQNYRRRMKLETAPAAQLVGRSPWITPREAAAYLGVHVETIYERVRQGV
jgi:hypothetical protein